MDFQKEVLDKSHQIPVVVDFWAPWCGPCQFLGPVIEELAREQTGKWELVKLNTDENQEISTQYGIRGIPAVKMFSKGKVIADFTGALPKHQIEQWLNEHLPSEEKETWHELQQQLPHLEREPALTQLQAFLEKYPEQPEANLYYGFLLAPEDPEKAKQILEEKAHDPRVGELRMDLRHLIELTQCDPEGVVAQQIKTAQYAYQKGEWSEMLENLIDAIGKNRQFCDDLGRKACIAIFHFLGDGHEVTRTYRRRFDMALY